MNDVATSREIYQFRIVVRDTSPHLWRRIQVCHSLTLGDFHHILQVAFGWSGSRPARFLIRGKAHGINSPDGQDDIDPLRLADFHFLPKERFFYEYDVDSHGRPRWRHQVRFERALGVEPRRFYPVCLGGVGAAPPENCKCWMCASPANEALESNPLNSRGGAASDCCARLP